MIKLTVVTLLVTMNVSTITNMKLYYVYYAIQENDKPKVGASSNIKARISMGKYKFFKLLECFTCPKKCGDREIELQLLYFNKRDTHKHYTDLLKLPKTYKPKSTTNFKNIPSARKKAWFTTKLSRKEIEFIKENYFKPVNQYIKKPKGKYDRYELANMFAVTPATISTIFNKRNKYIK